MMVALFCLILVAVMYAWAGFHFAAQFVFAINLLMAMAWFGHHMTSVLSIQL